MELKVVIDEDKLKELVEEAARRIKEEMCANCPYREDDGK